jgi:CHRD domain
MKRLLSIPALSLALGLAIAAPAQAHSGNGQGQAHGHRAGHPAGSVAGIATLARAERAKGPALFLAAKLSAAQEVPAADGKATGDPDGAAVAFIKVKGNRVTYSVTWKGVSAPTLGHLHNAPAGKNGPVAVTLFGTPMPDTVDAAVGAAAFEDATLADKIRTNPTDFYFNLHTAEFPGGAVRGQFNVLNRPVNLLSVIRGGATRAMADGEQEVPAPPAVEAGDQDGFASAFLRTSGSRLRYSLAWVGIGAPTLGHIHQGKRGVNGPVKIGLFTTPVPTNVFALSGRVLDAQADVVKQVRAKPSDFYVNLHTAEFKDGAVRGQLFR